MASTFIIFLVLAIYTFNMTQDLLQEERVLQICYDKQIELDYCFDRYGGIGTEYGEPIQ